VKLRVLILAAFGLAFTLYLFMYIGPDAVFSAAVGVGWGGFAILCVYALGLFLILGAAWHVLLPGAAKKLGVFVAARMVRDAATEVLPFSQLGGIVLGARAAILHGIAHSVAIASTIVDVTTEMLAQIAYIALGAVIFGARAPRIDFAASLTRGLVIGLVAALAGGGVFLAQQRHHHGITQKIAVSLFRGKVATAAAVTAALDDTYRSPSRVGVSTALHLAGWIASAFGSWMAFRLMGTRADFISVVALESLVCAARSAAFLVPHALGVQEAAYAILCPLLGIGAEYGLAVSLLKRGRDIAVGVPILLIWQLIEGRRVLGHMRP
jgi:glycosyltransferase 2 family protein